jgi:hypothetical protein
MEGNGLKIRLNKVQRSLREVGIVINLLGLVFAVVAQTIQ